MGCCHTTAASTESHISLSLCDEEITISQYEASSPFSSKSSKLLTSEFLMLGESSSINFSQFELACSHLGINPRLFISQYPNFIESLKDSPQTYDIKKIILVCILLGKGKPREKCNLLFDYTDANSDDIVSVKDVEKMLSDLIDASLILTPMTAIGHNKLSLIEIENYCEGLVQSKRKLIKKLKYCIMGEEKTLDSSQFDVKIFDSEILQNIINPNGIRILLKNQHFSLSSLEESPITSDNKSDAFFGRESSGKDLSLQLRSLNDEGSPKEVHTATESMQTPEKPMVIDLNFGPGQKEKLYLYRNDDLDTKVKNFARTHRLNKKEADGLLNYIEKIRQDAYKS
ncbi:unnamed protein product [Blepharisma stoltei]|uniref:EF-hand domain-containing protein n=1 Tax=Blepharisma stoltei TaxID=1481888 RepID=A0AAU9K8Z7_9CILI|nr:unnamed protein product [Blepharisma stoltei]